MNREQYDKFMDRVREEPHACKHGHPECSDRPAGLCCDEEWRPEFDDIEEDDYAHE